MPYIKGVTHHAIDAEVLSRMKHTCHVLNFSRAEIVDGAALRRIYDAGHQVPYDKPQESLTMLRQLLNGYFD